MLKFPQFSLSKQIPLVLASSAPSQITEQALKNQNIHIDVPGKSPRECRCALEERAPSDSPISDPTTLLVPGEIDLAVP
ncbi:uncharacterized protein PHALS_13417 [Plasmopara halstedii]|uniref:Uncharacterized protein n=1 Tax=Plasmopara halstedii TaxID=4781 RepID=A0A0P1AQ23_PLAHL|nr:uncharacterized protein PHALS_13417 [Plasmopara halstedii]CEG43204.1 hypothetical protein PHALS_13417 [Plasmopara halstedii]|eukprot:XP_024579573.1 hypothetical protein PHALS_13417 [Plasmopara halstedii]